MSDTSKIIRLVFCCLPKERTRKRMTVGIPTMSMSSQIPHIDNELFIGNGIFRSSPLYK